MTINKAKKNAELFSSVEPFELVDWRRLKNHPDDFSMGMVDNNLTLGSGERCCALWIAFFGLRRLETVTS